MLNYLCIHAIQQPWVFRTKRYKIPELHPLIKPYLCDASLLHASQIPDFEYDRVLISAFVQRWYLETHTFHLSYRECTITLQDVAFQLGLHIDGDPVRGCMSSWKHFEGNDILSLCNELLGVVPGPEHAMSTLWIAIGLWRHFNWVTIQLRI